MQIRAEPDPVPAAMAVAAIAAAEPSVFYVLPRGPDLTQLACAQGEPGQKIADDVRKYRQSIFKLNHKLKKSRQQSDHA